MSNGDAVEKPLLQTPHEQALQSLCKQILKARLFRGYYRERRHVNEVNGYRDIVSLQRSERELEKLLLDIHNKITIFYYQSRSMWIGVTHGALLGEQPLPDALQTHIWTELVDVAFGQYWFSIKNVRFRYNEIFLKLKVVRAVEPEPFLTPRSRISFSARSVSEKCVNDNSLCSETSTACKLPDKSTSINATAATTTTSTATEQQTTTASPPDIGLQDFIDLLFNWGTSIKWTVYEFLSKDVSKENIKALLKFIGLLVVSILSCTFVAIKYFGVFVLRFMFEFSRFTHTVSPIVIKTIEVVQKVVAGFYLLLAMIWRDATNNRRPAAPPPPPEVQYQPQFKSITYSLHQHDGMSKKPANKSY